MTNQLLTSHSSMSDIATVTNHVTKTTYVSLATDNLSKSIIQSSMPELKTVTNHLTRTGSLATDSISKQLTNELKSSTYMTEGLPSQTFRAESATTLETPHHSTDASNQIKSTVDGTQQSPHLSTSVMTTSVNHIYIDTSAIKVSEQGRSEVLSTIFASSSVNPSKTDSATEGQVL